MSFVPVAGRVVLPRPPSGVVDVTGSSSKIDCITGGSTDSSHTETIGLPTASADRLHLTTDGDPWRRPIINNNDVVPGAIPQAPLTTHKGRLGDVLLRKGRQILSIPLDASNYGLELGRLIASRMALGSPMVPARFITSAATSNSAWVNPSGSVHCLPLAC